MTFFYSHDFVSLEGEYTNGKLKSLLLTTDSSTSLNPKKDSIPLLVKESLDNYISGEASSFDSIDELLDMTQGTEFERKVWKTLRTIPYGEKWSYSQLAEKLDKPSAVRAVASACGRNPFHLAIPCHRVIRSDGSLGGFAAGINIKERLLIHESNN